MGYSLDGLLPPQGRASVAVNPEVLAAAKLALPVLRKVSADYASAVAVKAAVSDGVDYVKREQARAAGLRVVKALVAGAAGVEFKGADFRVTVGRRSPQAFGFAVWRAK